MSGLHFPDLSIKGFRGFKELCLSQFGRVTLITGKNNTGKTSVLEALYIHAHNASPAALASVLGSREENAARRDSEESLYDPNGDFILSPIFTGFPRISDIEPIVFTTDKKRKFTEIAVERVWPTEDAEGRPRLVSTPPTTLPESDPVLALVTTTEARKRRRRLVSLSLLSRRTPYRLPPEPSDDRRIPCVLVSSSRRAETLGHMWDGIALTDSETYVVEALQIIDPRISGVSMIADEDSIRGRRAIVRASHIRRPVPLRSFGEGLNHLFAITLSLISARGGVLLLDEFENGLHYTVQHNAWRMIFRLAESLNVQVFATSHSWDAVESFQEAADEASSNGALLRLVNRSGDIIPTIFTEDELAIVTRDRIEVR